MAKTLADLLYEITLPKRNYRKLFLFNSHFLSVLLGIALGYSLFYYQFNVLSDNVYGLHTSVNDVLQVVRPNRVVRTTVNDAEQIRLYKWPTNLKYGAGMALNPKDLAVSPSAKASVAAKKALNFSDRSGARAAPRADE